jgi:hypothetical protein
MQMVVFTNTISIRKQSAQASLGINTEKINQDDNVNIFWPPSEYNSDGSDKNLTLVTDQIGRYPFDWQDKRDLSSDNHTSSDLNDPAITTLSANKFADKLVKSESRQHDANHLCGSKGAKGWDFVSLAYGTFCDMNSKKVWPLCSNTTTHSCFDNDIDEMRIGLHDKREFNGVAIPVKRYSNVTTWGR